MANEIQHAFQIQGNPVPVDHDERVSLTALWAAAGSPKDRNPQKWLKTGPAVEFVDSLTANSKGLKTPLLKSVRGNTAGRGVWGHWQIALAYAKWLSPEFHQHVNEGFRQWQEEDRNPGLKLDRAVDRFTKQGRTEKWIKARFDGKLSRNSLTSTLKAHQCQRDAFPRVTDIGNLTVVGKTAKEFRKATGLPDSAQTRDHMSRVELTALAFFEASVEERVESDAAIGDEQCVDSAMSVSAVLQPAMRALRQQSRPSIASS